MGATIEWHAKEGEVEAKSRKPRQWGSVPGAPMEMAAEGDGWRWCGDVVMQMRWWWGVAFANARREGD